MPEAKHEYIPPPPSRESEIYVWVMFMYVCVCVGGWVSVLQVPLSLDILIWNGL